MSELNHLLDGLGGFLQRMAVEQEEIGAAVATTMGGANTGNAELSFAIQHFDRTRQNLEAIGDVMVALSSGATPAKAVAPIHLEELRSWLDGNRDKIISHAGEVDFF
jgi:hypothetical protein